MTYGPSWLSTGRWECFTNVPCMLALSFFVSTGVGNVWQDGQVSIKTRSSSGPTWLLSLSEEEFTWDFTRWKAWTQWVVIMLLILSTCVHTVITIFVAIVLKEWIFSLSIWWWKWYFNVCGEAEFLDYNFRYIYIIFFFTYWKEIKISWKADWSRKREGKERLLSLQSIWLLKTGWCRFAKEPMTRF